MIKRLFESYRRWRHSKGYGVHSPFAFSIVENVINLPERYGYYGYNEIYRSLMASKKSSTGDGHKDTQGNKAFGNDFIVSGKDEERARMALRLMGFLKCREMFLISDVPGVYKAAAKGAGARIIPVGLSQEKYSKERSKGDKCMAGGLLLTYGELERPKLDEAASFMNGGIAVMALYPDDGLRRLLCNSLKEGVVFEDKEVVIALPRAQTSFVNYSCIL